MNRYKKTLASFLTIALALVAILFTVIAPRGEAQETELPSLIQSYRIQITDDFEGYQYLPVAGTTVVFYLERMVSPEGNVEWEIDQIAGPWGNSRGLGDPQFRFDSTYASEFMEAFQEAQRVSLWLGNYTDNFEWQGHTLDVREQLRIRSKGGG